MDQLATRELRTHRKSLAGAKMRIETLIGARKQTRRLNTLKKTRTKSASSFTTNAFSYTSILTSSIMVNPLLLLPALNASSLRTTGPDGCYTQNPPGQTQLVSTTYIVCTQAINRIATGRALNTPINFGRTVKVGHKLPDFFTQKGFYGTCVIMIDMKEGQEDTLTWRDIVVSASSLRDICVAPPPHLGGEGKAGPRQLLDVFMYGLGTDAELPLPLGSSGTNQGQVFDA